MTSSNLLAVNRNSIPDDDRLDVVVPRNGALEQAYTAAFDLTAYTLAGAVKTSYEAAAVAFNLSFKNKSGANFTAVFDASHAKALGIDCPDGPYDIVATPTGTGSALRIFAGLCTFSKGVT